MRNLEEKEIKQFSEFTEVTPESSQNLITDKGRFTVGALFSAVVAYATDLINAAVSSAVNGVQALITSAAEDAAEEAVEGVQETIAAATSSAVTQAETAKTAAESAKTAAETAKSGAETAKETAVAKAEQAASDADAVAADKAAVQSIKTEVQSLKSAAEAAAQSAQEAAFSKANAPQLWFNRGKLNVPDWPSVVLPLPFSLAIEYEVESWDGISYEYNNEFSFFNCTNADWDASGYPIYGFRLTKSGGSQLGFTLGGCGGEGMGSSRGWGGNIPLPTGRHTVAIAIPAPDAGGNSPAAIPVYIDGSMAGNLVASVGKHNASVSFQKPLVINERGVYTGGTTFNEFEIALSRISIFSFDISAESSPYTVADYAAGKPVPPSLLRSSIFGDKSYNIYYRSNASNNYDVATNTLSFYQPAGSESALASLLFNVNFPVPIAAGKKVRITYDSITGDAVQNSSGSYGYISFYDSSSQYVLGEAQLTNLGGETIVKTQMASYASRKLERVCVYVYTTASSESDQTIKMNGLRIEVDGAVLCLDGSADGLQARDMSEGGHHAWMYGGVRAGRPRAAGQSNWRLSWTSGSSTGAYCGQNSAALALPEFSLSRVRVRSDNAATFKVGDASNAAAYSAELSVPASGWAELEITTKTASALTFTPTAALSAATNLDIIIEHRRTY